MFSIDLYDVQLSVRLYAGGAAVGPDVVVRYAKDGERHGRRHRRPLPSHWRSCCRRHGTGSVHHYGRPTGTLYLS